jgi:hypothetical protein
VAEPPLVAVTVAVSVVESTVVASPCSLERSDVGFKEPFVVEKLTRTEGTALPCWSSTRARTFDVPPPIGNVCGAAVTTIHDAVAAPKSTSMVYVAPPEVARTTAVPDIPLPTSRAVARPEVVCASAGSIRPSVVVKNTSVPL